jgi:hypothetical protein
LKSFSLYSVPSKAQPVVVVSLREAPEIVLLGEVTPLEIADFLKLPGGILINSDPSRPNELRISRFQPGKQDQRVVVPPNVAAVIAGVEAVGGGYGDVIGMLRAAKDRDYLKAQLAIDPLPAVVRTYHRNQGDSDSESEEDSDSDSEKGSDSEKDSDSESEKDSDSDDPQRDRS